MKKRILSLILVACFLLTACGGASTSQVDDNGKEKTSKGSGGQIADIPREKTVIFENIDGSVPVPDNMNIFTTTQYLQWGVWQTVYESLFYYNLETDEIVPWQASGYEFNDDFTECRIFIRDGVTWSDGVPFTADDVVFTINMVKENSDLRFSSDMNTWVEDVTAVNDKEVLVKLTNPYPGFILENFSCKMWQSMMIAPKHIWENEDPNTFTNFDLEKNYPIGTGPYHCVRSTETETVFDRNDSWWGEETGFEDMPAPERCIWVGVTSEEIRVSALAKNELDGSWTMSRSGFETAKSQNDKIISYYEDLPYAYLNAPVKHVGFNNAAPPFDQKELRWAINYALDRDEIIAITYEGTTTPAWSMFNSLPCFQDFLNRNKGLLDTYDVLTHDLDKSAKMMESIGYTKDSDGFWSKDGERLTFELNGRANEGENQKQGPIIVEQLRQAGFDCEYKPLESATYYNEVFSGKSVFHMGGGGIQTVANPYSTMNTWHSKYYKPIGEMTDNRAYRVRNEELDKCIDTMAVNDPESQEFNDAADRGLEILTENLYTIPINESRLLTPFNETYWTNWPSEDNIIIQPDEWWMSANIIIHNIQPVK